METVRLSLLFLHLLGMGVLLGTFLVQRRAAPQGPLNAGWLHGGLLQLLTGLGLVGINEAQEHELDNAKIAVKFVVLLVILGAVLAYRRRDAIPAWLAPGLVSLVVINTAVATFWT